MDDYGYDVHPDASYTGVDGAPLDDPEKLWRCDVCGRVGTEKELANHAD